MLCFKMFAFFKVTFQNSLFFMVYNWIRLLADPDQEAEDSGEFGLIPPSLIRLLKNILAQYPDNGQIIKVCILEYIKLEILQSSFPWFF